MADWGSSGGNANGDVWDCGNDGVSWDGDGRDAGNGCGQTSHPMEACTDGAFAAAGGGAGDHPASDDKCFGCGEPGHRRAECPTKGEIECRYCKQPGHMVRDCPDKGPMLCDNCGEEGHLKGACEKPRKISRDHVADVSAELAWEKLKKAAADSDHDDAKEALQEYVKALDGTPTYKEIQLGLINDGTKLWFIALERPLSGAFTNMDLQGNVGKKYAISYRFSDKPSRPREREGWPMTRDEILSRLEDAGEPVSSGKQRCYNCEEFGHNSKTCPEPKRERVEEANLCPNCNAEGHRLRDCPQPRVDKFACRNCGKSGHKAADCEEPPNLDNIDCRKCAETGHMSRDCPQGGSTRACHNCGQEGHVSKECPEPRNMDNVTCRNCEKTGHVSKECPEPRDWTKVQCSNCQQFGHTKVRCREPTVEPQDYSGNGQPTGDGWTGENGAWDNGASFTAHDGFADTGDVGANGWVDKFYVKCSGSQELRERMTVETGATR